MGIPPAPFYITYCNAPFPMHKDCGYSATVLKRLRPLPDPFIRICRWVHAVRKTGRSVPMNMNVSKTNGVKLLAAMAVLAMVVCAFAAVMPAEQTDAASGNTQSYSGTLTWNQEFPLGTNVVINDDLVITKGTAPEGEGADTEYKGMVITGNLTINEGVTVTIQNGGILKVSGGLVTINGDVDITGEGSTFNVTSTDSDYKTQGVIVNGSIDVVRNGVLSGETDASILVNNGGELNVTSSGSRISTITGINVDLAVGGSFHFDGKVEDENATMTVTSYGSGSNKTTASATITAGTRTAGDNSTSDITFSTTGGSYTAYAAGSDSGILMREYALNIEGSIDGADSIAFSGVVTVNDAAVDGSPDDNGTAYFTSADAAKQNATQYWGYADYVMGTLNITTLDVNNGSKLTVDKTAYVVVGTTLNVDLTTKTEGEGAAATVKPVPETFKLDGIVEVVGTVTMNGQSLTATSGNYAKGTIAINGGNVTITDGGNSDALPVAVYGAIWIDDDDDETGHITDLATALTDAQTAGIEDVYVVGLQKSFGQTGEQASFNGRGAYVVDSSITIPDNMVLNIICGLKIAEDAVLTVPSSAALSFAGNYSGIWVDGKLVDYDTITDDQIQCIQFEVMSQTETESDIINTYTTFAIALAETTEGTIYLYNDIEIDRNMEIPENVTVQYAADTTGSITFEANTKYTFTVSGELYLSAGHNFNTTGGTVVVNNTIRYDSGVTIGETSGTPAVDGAYYSGALEADDSAPYNYITSIAIAAENSSALENAAENNVIAIYGNVAMGDVTFTKNENAQALGISIMNSGDDKATGNITLAAGASFLADAGIFDGTVTMDTTAGTTVVDLNNSSSIMIALDSEETAEGTTSSMQMASTERGTNDYGTIDGTVTIVSGTVEIPTTTIVEKLMVSQGATLNVNAQLVAIANPDYKFNTTSSNLPVFTEEFIANTAGLIVDGTLNIDENADVQAIITHIGGNVTVDGSFYAYLSCIDGTVAAGDAGASQLAVALLNGTVSGDAVFEAVVAFPGSNIAEADLGEINSTVVYVNGTEFGTFYAKNNVAIESILLAMDVDGVKISTADFCTDADMKNSFSDISATDKATLRSQLTAVVTAIQKITDVNSLNDVKTALNSIVGTPVGTYTEVYIGMEPADVQGSITVYQGMDLYIDGQAIENFWNQTLGKYVLSVGSHQFAVQVNPGYTGTPVITLDGQTITGGSFTISNDASSFQIVVTGDIAVDTGSSGSSDGMGLTEILLIILVVLIVIMAIMVALRLMRS